MPIALWALPGVVGLFGFGVGISVMHKGQKEGSESKIVGGGVGAFISVLLMLITAFAIYGHITHNV